MPNRLHLSNYDSGEEVRFPAEGGVRMEWRMTIDVTFAGRSSEAVACPRGDALWRKRQPRSSYKREYENKENPERLT